MRIRFRDAVEREEFLREIRRMFEIFRKGQPGNAVILALTRKKIRDGTFEAADTAPRKGSTRGIRNLEAEHNELEAEEAFWAGWPESLRELE